eukprot:1308013-Rhodomonas_salina.1
MRKHSTEQRLPGFDLSLSFELGVRTLSQYRTPCSGRGDSGVVRRMIAEWYLRAAVVDEEAEESERAQEVLGASHASTKPCIGADHDGVQQQRLSWNHETR